MSKVKKQHYLPQFYLRNFADNAGRLCVVDSTIEADFIKSRVQDIAQGRYYYDFLGDEDNQTLEKFFGKMEGLLSPYFSEIIELAQANLPLLEIHKSVIHKFIELQFLRSDWMRHNISQDFIRTNFKEDYLEHGESLLHAYIIKDRMLVNLLDYISEYEFRVIQSEHAHSLFTSSFPMFFSNENDTLSVIKRLEDFGSSGRGSLNANLFFPISSNYCIYIYDINRPTTVFEGDWFSAFVTSGLAWSHKRIYFRETDLNAQLYPAMKPLLKLPRIGVDLPYR